MKNLHAFKNKKLAMIVSAVVIIATTGLLIFFFADLGKPTEYGLSGHTLTVKGTFSEDIPLEGAEVVLMTTPLEITYKVNGSAAGKKCKGTFRVAGIEGNVYLNLMDKDAEYIRITNNGMYYFINKESPQKTQELYEEIINR